MHRYNFNGDELPNTPTLDTDAAFSPRTVFLRGKVQRTTNESEELPRANLRIQVKNLPPFCFLLTICNACGLFGVLEDLTDKSSYYHDSRESLNS